MQTIVCSLIVYDARDIRITVANDREPIRQDLVEYFNEMMAQEDEPYCIDAETSLDDVVSLIEEDLNELVLIEETVLCEAA